MWAGVIVQWSERLSIQAGGGSHAEFGYGRFR